MHPETAFHISVAELLAYIVLPPAEWTTFPAGNVHLPKSAGALLHRMGLATGWPDLLILHRAIYGIELKVPGGALTRTHAVRSKRTGRSRIVDGQQDVHPRLIAAGMQIAVCDSLEGVTAALRGWDVPMRRVS